MNNEETERRLRITTTAELLKAVELGIVDKTEARHLLGLGVKRGRLAKLQPRAGGRFTRGEVVYPFNRFTAGAGRAMIQAQDLAKGDGRSHADTADMLVALVHQGAGGGVLALRQLGVGEEQVRSTLAGIERAEQPLEGMGPTAQLKNVVETAFHGVGYPGQVGTRHLVVALATCDGAASAALGKLGATPEALRAELDRMGAEGDGEES